MARIRTIKPEFPQSESIGRLSRESRLLFILLWTFVDDSGKSRASSRMLASLLYPYDDDAPKKIDDWLGELELNGHILIYDANGSRYLKVLKWDEHQRIDHPGKSRLPEPSSEILAKPRDSFSKPTETLATDLGPRTLDLGPRKERTGKTLLPDSWLPSDDHYALGDKEGLAREEVERGGEEMRSWSLGNGERRRDWNRVFDNWLRRKATKEKSNGLETDRDRRKRESREALAELRAFGEGRKDGDFGGSAIRLLPRTGTGGGT